MRNSGGWVGIIRYEYISRIEFRHHDNKFIEKGFLDPMMDDTQ